jgi:hypothetical protein
LGGYSGEFTDKGAGAMRKKRSNRYDVPLLGADDKCLWIEMGPGARMERRWDEVVRVTAGKIDCKFRIDRTIEVGHEAGDYLEFNDSCPGFDSVVSGINRHLPGVLSDWVEQLDEAGPRDPSIVVWKKGAE